MVERHPVLRCEPELFDLGEAGVIASERPDVVERLTAPARSCDERMQRDKRDPVGLDHR